MALITSGLNILAALAAFAAAYFWYKASTVSVPPGKPTGGYQSAQITVIDGLKEEDPFATGAASATINQKAAVCAGISALLQGVAIVCSLIS